MASLNLLFILLPYATLFFPLCLNRWEVDRTGQVSVIGDRDMEMIKEHTKNTRSCKILA